MLMVYCANSSEVRKCLLMVHIQSIRSSTRSPSSYPHSLLTFHLEFQVLVFENDCRFMQWLSSWISHRRSTEGQIYCMYHWMYVHCDGKVQLKGQLVVVPNDGYLILVCTSCSHTLSATLKSGFRCSTS